MSSRGMRENGSGCYDPTAYHAIVNSEKQRKEEWSKRDENRVNYLLREIHAIAATRGFTIENRIVFRDKKTKKVFK